MPATGSLIGTPCSIIANVSAAHRSHRRRAVGFSDFGNHTIRVGNFSCAGTMPTNAAGKRTVPDFASAWAAHRSVSPAEKAGKL